MISYSIEPHDITTLTAPMWDACGIGCPAMIGADCPRKADESCPGMSSKFGSAAAEVIYGWDPSETCGGGETGHAWYGLFRNPDASEHDGPMGAGVVLVEYSSGATHAERFDSVAALDREWGKILTETRECPYENDGCTGTALCEQCTDDNDDDDD